MKIKTSDFVMSNSDYIKCPEPTKPEYAFIGRSNVGKSSLINMLTERKALAKISGTPGKTQLINHFIINDEWYLVDLPGYGYAKTSKALRGKFQEMIQKYVINRTNLICLFVLIDSRHEAQKVDLDFMRFLGEKEVPFAMVFTKADKLGGNKVKDNIKKYQKKMLEEWEYLPDYFISSSVNKDGRDEILTYIEDVNKNVEF